jgi:Domain of unknown function (DUF1906)
MIAMRAERAPTSAATLTFGVDTVATLTAANFAALAPRVSWRAGYIERITEAELAAQLAAGIALLPVTFALDFDSATTIARLAALGVPRGVTVFVDVEGANLDAASLVASINTWARALRVAGYDPGIYVGAGCPLTSDQLYGDLDVDRYWHSCSRVPSPNVRGDCVRQLRPNDVSPAGVDVDVDIIETDYLGDTPTLAVAA